MERPCCQQVMEFMRDFPSNVMRFGISPLGMDGCAIVIQNLPLFIDV